MSASCCDDKHASHLHEGVVRTKRVLWAVLIINLVMFGVEVGAGFIAGSVALQADALDFLGDAGNYLLSLFVIGMSLRTRARTALFKALTMGVFGLWVIGTTIFHAVAGIVPEPLTMGVVGLCALLANAVCFGLLWSYRAADANMRSAWICTRNDVVGNSAVLLAALGVFGTGAWWPDVIVAAIMASLALQGSIIVLLQSRSELRMAGA